MEGQTLDPAEFRDGQRQQWETAAAGWRKWSPAINAGGAAVAERIKQAIES